MTELRFLQTRVEANFVHPYIRAGHSFGERCGASIEGRRDFAFQEDL
jgi:hypothetical protein